jgi:hypothetical protein
LPSKADVSADVSGGRVRVREADFDISPRLFTAFARLIGGAAICCIQEPKDSPLRCQLVTTSASQFALWQAPAVVGLQLAAVGALALSR